MAARQITIGHSPDPYDAFNVLCAGERQAGYRGLKIKYLVAASQ